MRRDEQGNMRSVNVKSPSFNTVRVLFRFCLRLVVLLSFAGLGQNGYGWALLALLLMSVAMCAAWASAQREPLFGPSLTNWDEAAAYGCLASLTALIVQG
jgi:hypothetical protein